MNKMDAPPSGGADLDQFLYDTPAFFGHDYRKAHALERGELEDLQFRALKKRFADLRDNVATLKKIADDQKIENLERLEDVTPLLFRHTVYKSYPISLLEKGRFKQLTQWMNKLTTFDLSGVDVSACQGIDDWIRALDEQTPLSIRHSSGTTGIMSFIPRSLDENTRHFFNTMMKTFGPIGSTPPAPGKPLSMHLVQPTNRSGNTGILRANDDLCTYIAGGDEAKMHFLYPYRQSSDLMFLAGRLRAAQANGELDRLELSPALLARKSEFEKLQRDMAKDFEVFFDKVISDLKGERIYTFAVTPLLYSVAAKGLESGMEGVFARDSIVGTGGGAKGQVLPDNWEDVVKRFFGIDHISRSYGMSEMMCANKLCSHNRYHMEPTCILYILDPDTGECLPRNGVQTGRAAFYDLLADSYWGGFISGDEVTVDYSTPCGCGQKSPHLSMQIQRYSEKNGGDDKISCAAATEAHDDALGFLNEVSV